MEKFLRTEKLLGKEGVNKLKNSSVIVFGLGGVGSYAAEALARSGVGEMALVDFDVVAVSNLNRQLIATVDTVGQKKVAAEKERLLKINPDLKIEVFDEFFDENSSIDLGKYDYVIDAIDSMDAKVFLTCEAEKKGVKIISCMSAGNKLDGTRFRVADIFDTTVCPIAKIMRKRLKEKGIKSLKVVYSDEPPAEIKEKEIDGAGKNVGSVAFVPGIAGLIMAGEAIKDLIKE